MAINITVEVDEITKDMNSDELLELLETVVNRMTVDGVSLGDIIKEVISITENR